MKITNIIRDEDRNEVVEQVYMLIKSEPRLTPRSKAWIKRIMKAGGLFAAIDAKGQVGSFIVREHVWGTYYEIKSWYCRPEARSTGIAHKVFRADVSLPGEKFLSVSFFPQMIERLRRYGYVPASYWSLPIMVNLIFLMKRPWRSVGRHIFRTKSYLAIRR